MALPTAADVVAYLGGAGNTSWSASDPELIGALAAETAAQSRVCRIPTAYPTDLAEALLRRVARNLELRKVPLGVQQGDADTSATYIPTKDPEIKRLEAPFRKMVMG